MGRTKKATDFAGIALRFISLTAVLLGLLWIFFADTHRTSALVTNSGVFFYGDTSATNQGVLRARTFSSPSTANAEFNGAAASSTSFIVWTIAKTATTREEMMIGTLKNGGKMSASGLGESRAVSGGGIKSGSGSSSKSSKSSRSRRSSKKTTRRRKKG